MLLFCVFLLLITWLYIYSKKKYDFWVQKGVKGPKPLPLVGNFAKLYATNETVQELFCNLYNRYPDEKFIGIYRGFQPIVLLRDPELIKQIMIKDFPLFPNRNFVTGFEKLSNNLFEAKGDTWRILRQKLTPIFTSKKLRDMVPLVEQCVNNYISYIDNLVENNIDHEIKSLQAKYTLQVIGSCVFGLHLNTFSDKEDEFSIMARRIANPPIFRKAIVLLDYIVPGIKKILTAENDIQNFFLDFVSKLIKQSENEPMKRKNLMDLMVELKKQGKVGRRSEQDETEIEFDDTMIAAQAFIFYAAGFETSASAMSFMVHELALHQDIQDKVYEEICNVTAEHDSKINYDSLKQMTYLEMAFKETLRKNSVAVLLGRNSFADYVLPGTDVTVPKGTPLLVSVAGLHEDSKYYEHPERFDPERFTPEKVAARPQCTYLPFGEGPRNCIGRRFAYVQSLMAMAAFLKRFRVEPTAKTKTPLEFKVQNLTAESRHGIWVKISKR